MYQTFKWTHHVSTFCSFVFHKITESTLSCHVLDFIQLLLPMYVTSVMHFSFFRYEMNGTKTLIDELLCVVYPLWRNVVSLGGIVQNLYKKKNWVQMSDKVEISGLNSSKLSSEVSPSTIFYYVMPPWYSRCEKENSRRIGNYGKTSS